MVSHHEYSRVNEALNKVFFDGRFAGQPVYLALDNKMRSELADILACKPAEVEDVICASVRGYLYHSGDPYGRVGQDTTSWRRKGMQTPPPFTGVLFCLSHAATLMAAEGDFGANNYYLRLTQVTGLAKEALTAHRKSTDLFWGRLAEWLLENNYALGQPTARSTNAWKYVGKAISQAVVRASDRENFHDLFEKFGFSGNEAISVKEMEHYIAYWINTAASGQRLKRVWRDLDLRERVAEAAIAELASWSATPASKTGLVTRPLKLSLFVDLVPAFPRTTLEMHLGRIGETEEQDSFRLTGEEAEFFLNNEAFGSLATVSPSPFGSNGEGLGNSFRFNPSRPSAKLGLEWNPRIIIPLAVHPQVNMWMETPRISYAVPHMLLVRDAKNLPARVERYLAGVCTSPPSRATSQELGGLASGWVLYQDVQIRKIVEPESDQLECLMPLGAEGSMDIIGGLQLMPNFYHSSSQLTVNFFAPSGPVKIMATNKEEGPAIAEAASNGNECSLQLSSDVFAEGSVYLQALQQDKKLVTKQVFFRDANKPQPLNQNTKSTLSYRNIISASQTTAIAEIAIEGMTTRGVFPDPATQHVFWPSIHLPEGEGEGLQMATHSSALQAYGSAQICIERGYHITVFPMVPSYTAAGTPFEGTCNDCQRREVVIYRKRKNASTSSTPQPLDLPSIKSLAPKKLTQINYDELLDALCFLGHGSWARFQSLVEFWGEGTKPARQVAHELFVLGFLDLSLKAGTNSIGAWSVPSASINFTSPHLAFLAGFRSASLVAEIALLVRAMGGEVVTQEIDGRPPMITIKGLDAPRLKETLGEVTDPLFRPLEINTDAAMKIAYACDQLEGIEAALVPASIGRAKNLQRFDTARAKWVDTASALSLGAYRWNNGFQCYAHVRENGQTVAGPYQLIKTLAANEEGRYLHFYEPRTNKFLATLGCEPVGLLERALVACSGHLPTISKGVSIYENVLPEIATQVFKHLYKGPIGNEARQSN